MFVIANIRVSDVEATGDPDGTRITPMPPYWWTLPATSNDDDNDSLT